MAAAPDSSPQPLAAAYASWIDFGWQRHAAAVLLLAAIVALRYASQLFAAHGWVDERIYERAFARLAAGGSPYAEPGYYYLPALAYAGAALQRAIGLVPLRALLRAANVIGASVCLWVSAAWWWRARASRTRLLGERLLLAVALALAAPALQFGFEVGNLSLAISGLVVLSLQGLARRPRAAGLLLGASLLAKPMAAVVPLILVAATRGRRAAATTVAVLAGGVGAIGLVAFPYLGEFLAQPLTPLSVARTVSLYRLLQLLALPVDRVVIFAVVAGLAWLVAWRRSPQGAALWALSGAAMVLSAPTIWTHTLLVFLPVAIMALTLASAPAGQRSGLDDRRAARRARWELALVAALVALVLGFQGGGFEDLAPAAQLAMLLPPLAAPILLALYVARRCEPERAPLTPPRPRDTLAPSEPRGGHRGLRSDPRT